MREIPPMPGRRIQFGVFSFSFFVSFRRAKKLQKYNSYPLPNSSRPNIVLASGIGSVSTRTWPHKISRHLGQML